MAGSLWLRSHQGAKVSCPSVPAVKSHDIPGVNATRDARVARESLEERRQSLETEVRERAEGIARYVQWGEVTE